MTANNDLLQQLADIYEPEFVSPWQPALGHWLLLAAALLLVSALLWQLYQRWQAGGARRAALAELKQIDWQEPAAAAAINQLLKRLLRSYQPQHPMLTANTKVWQQYLQQQLPANILLPDLQQLLYQPTTQNASDACQQWWQASAYFIKRFRPKTALGPAALGAKDA